MTKNRESIEIENYLDKEVKKLGGITRKWVCPGHRGVTDRIVFLRGIVKFVEAKTCDGKLEPHQEREIDRLIKQGADVRVVYGIVGVDNFIEDLKCQIC